MEIKRNIKITLEKAKEWYKQGGELKEVALQAFKEEELKDNKPRSWKEYYENYRNKLYWLNADSEVEEVVYPVKSSSERNTLPTEELTKKFRAYMQLISLRQAWIGDWKPDWNNFREDKWCIVNNAGKLNVGVYCNTSRSLSFPTEEMANDFMDCFKDLLEIAKPLI